MCVSLQQVLASLQDLNLYRRLCGSVQYHSDGGCHQGMAETSPLKCMWRSLDSLRVLDCSSAMGSSSAIAAAAAAAGCPEGGLDPGKAL